MFWLYRGSRRPSCAAGASASASVAAALQNGADVEVVRSKGPPPQAHRVAMLGASGVGKSALTSQFLSSDHMNTYDAVGERPRARDDAI